MSQPYVQVLVDFGLIDLSGNPFQLNDAVYGLLDTGTLGGGDLTDLTSFVQSVSVSRGRSRQLDQFNAGSATVVFNNSTRALDPLNEDSPYFPNVLPRCGIQITANGIPIFYGLVVDWDLAYDITGQDTMAAICSDNFTIFANQTLDAYTPSAETSGERIASVLARPEIDFLGTRLISTGASDLGAYSVNAGTNALNYMQLVTKSEQGYFYISANGVVVFKGNDDTLNQDSDAFFTDDGNGIPYQSLSNQFGDEYLYNYVITESPAGGPFVASDTISQARYQFQQYSLTDLLNSSSGEVEDIGLFLLGKYKTPFLRFTGLQVQMLGLSLQQQNTCCSVDLTDIISVKKTFSTGSPAEAIQPSIVSGITHEITPGSHVINYALDPSLVSVVGESSDVTLNGYRVVTWTESGRITVRGAPLDVEYLIVGGGGAGGPYGTGGRYPGGGGAGGLLTNLSGSPLTISNETLIVTVGTGGVNDDGVDSSLGASLVAVGGGLGGSGVAAGDPDGNPGGSGGGAGFNGSSSGVVGAGTAGQGNDGGAHTTVGGGGGGAAEAGNTDGNGSGGDGLSNSITGTAVTYAGGGAGRGGANGGTGGGGAPSVAGTDGLGGGGGGSNVGGTNGADGGDGVVILRWAV